MENQKPVPGILGIEPLGSPWATRDPFLFCVYHSDAYPQGNGEFGPRGTLAGRQLGNDFVPRDGWRMYHGREVPGFPVHPHRGFETVTVVRKGMVDHSDSLGGAGRYGHGDVQWMTAGKGIQHSEMFPLLNLDQPNPLELFQIWLNLPRKSKFVEPYYAMLWKEAIPVLNLKDDAGRSTRVEVVAGSLEGTDAPAPPPDSWAALRDHEVAIWYIQMEKEAVWTLPPASKEISRTLYFFEGDRLDIQGETVLPDHQVETEATFPLRLTNGDREGRLLLLQGLPIQEPVANYGPFVMNSMEEIQETIMDFSKTHFGGWPWPRPDMVHPAQKGRFALHPGGLEEAPS